MGNIIKTQDLLLGIIPCFGVLNRAGTDSFIAPTENVGSWLTVWFLAPELFTRWVNTIIES